MQLARVTGTIVATHKDLNLKGLTLLLLQPIDASGRPQGICFVGVDSVGSGIGEKVFFVKGREASLPFLPRVVPTDAAIVGIVDSCFIENNIPASQLL